MSAYTSDDESSAQDTEWTLRFSDARSAIENFLLLAKDAPRRMDLKALLGTYIDAFPMPRAVSALSAPIKIEEETNQTMVRVDNETLATPESIAPTSSSYHPLGSHRRTPNVTKRCRMSTLIHCVSCAAGGIDCVDQTVGSDSRWFFFSLR